MELAPLPEPFFHKTGDFADLRSRCGLRACDPWQVQKERKQ
jgi:hypothetical protein